MIHKTFKGGRTYSGAKATIAYLLDERVEEGTSRVFSGDSELTLSFIKYASRKNKWSWSSGVLAFSEILDDKIKVEIIEECRRILFCGLLPSEYNDLWINHEDKDRTELHYIIPRLELSTGLSFNPYFVTRDFHKKDLFQEYINLKYNLTSFKDAKEITSIHDNKHWKNYISKLKKKIDKKVLKLIKNGLINNRDEMIEYMREVGFELKYLGKESISFTYEEVITKEGEELNITMKGKQYGESYRDWESLEEEVKTQSQTVGKGVPRDIGKIRTALDKIIKQQADTNRKQYEPKRRKNLEASRDTLGREDRRETREHREGSNEETLSNRSERRRALPIQQTQTRSDTRESRDNIELREDYRGKDSHQRENFQREDNQREIIRRELRDDTIRTETLRRVRERENTERAITKATDRRDAYADERASKRLYSHNTAFDKRVKRSSIREDKREARRKRRYKLSFKKLKFRDAYHYKTLKRKFSRQKNRRIFKRIIRKLTNSINLLINRCEQEFNLRNQEVQQEFRRSHQSILKSLKSKVERELKGFNSSIDLGAFISSFGYEKDISKSSDIFAVFSHAKRDDEILIWREQRNNEYLFYNAKKREDKGNINHFITNRKSISPNTMRKICNKWLKNNEIREENIIKPSSIYEQAFSFAWYYLEERRTALHAFKDLSSSSIRWLENQKDVLSIDSDKAFYFKMNSKKKICAVVKMTEEESIMIEGDKSSPLVLGNSETAHTVYMFEDPLAMMYYTELHDREKQNLYICTMGADKESIKEALDVTLGYHQDISIVLAFSKTKIGEKEASKVLELLDESKYKNIKRENPENKELKEESREEVKPKKVIKNTPPSRGMGF